MNLTDYRRTPIHRALEAVRREAARFGVDVEETEIVASCPRTPCSTPPSTTCSSTASTEAQFSSARFGSTASRGNIGRVHRPARRAHTNPEVAALRPPPSHGRGPRRDGHGLLCGKDDATLDPVRDGWLQLAAVFSSWSKRTPTRTPKRSRRAGPPRPNRERGRAGLDSGHPARGRSTTRDSAARVALRWGAPRAWRPGAAHDDERLDHRARPVECGVAGALANVAINLDDLRSVERRQRPRDRARRARLIRDRAGDRHRMPGLGKHLRHVRAARSGPQGVSAINS